VRLTVSYIWLFFQVELFRLERRDEIKRYLPEIKAGKKAKQTKILDERKKKGNVHFCTCQVVG